MKNTTYRGNEDKEETYVPWVCEERDITIQHEKLMPVCKNITKQNCITIWKTDDKGNPVSFQTVFPVIIFVILLIKL